MNWIKNKIKQGWGWARRQWKKIFWSIGGVAVAASGGVLLTNQLTQEELDAIPVEFRLVTDKSNIIGQEVIGQYTDGACGAKCEFDPTIPNKVDDRFLGLDNKDNEGLVTKKVFPDNAAIRYFYKNGTIQKETGEVARTPNTVVYDVDSGGKKLPDNTYRMTSYSGNNFYNDAGTWHQVDAATTRKDHFDTQTALTVWERAKILVFGEEVRALDTTIYTGSSDGSIQRTDATWSAAQDTADGETVTTGTPSTSPSVESCDDGICGDFRINRYFFPFDTSALPNGATVSAATFTISMGGITAADNDGTDYLTVVQGSPADPESLVVGDYDACGDAIDNPTEGIDSGERIDISDATSNTSDTFTLNSTGRGWISDTGFTTLCVREGHDATDTQIANNGANIVPIFSHEEEGSAKDPKLDITYTVADGGATWCDTDYSNRQQIFIDDNVVDDDLTNFPLMVPINSTATSTAQTDGDDIFFVESANCTKLDYHFDDEDDNLHTGAPVAWVEVPTVASSTETVLYMYYGNASATDQEDETGTWDANFAAVWHFEETPGSASSTDSTSNNNDGDQNNMDSADQVSGQVDGSLDFDGTNDYVEAADSASLSITSALTVSAWVEFDTIGGSDELIVDKQTSGGDSYAFFIETADDTLRLGTSGANLGSASTISTGNWYYLVGTFDDSANEAILYIDGVQDAINSSFTDTMSDTSDLVRIGARSGSDRQLDGQIDEVRVSNTVRSAAWVKFDYYNQSGLFGIPAFGAEESVPSTAGTSDTMIID